MDELQFAKDGVVAREIDQIEDAEAIGPMIRDMISNVRKNSGMDGLELD